MGCGGMDPTGDPHRPAAVLGGGQQTAQNLRQQRAHGGGVNLGGQLRKRLAGRLADLMVEHLRLPRVEVDDLPTRCNGFRHMSCSMLLSPDL